MQLAQSRLQRSTSSSSQTVARPRHVPRQHFQEFTRVLKGFLRFLPTFLTGLFFYGCLATLLHFVYPETLANWLFPRSYLLFHCLLGLGNFFFFTALFQRKLWGWLMSVFIGWLAFLYLQGITLDFWAVGSAGALSLFSALWYRFIQKWGQKKKEA